MKKRIALITGITGQDGSYLAELLIEKGYIVHGILRRNSGHNTKRIDQLVNDNKVHNKFFFTHYGDLTDSNSIIEIIKKLSPDEIYNLAAQSHVGNSFSSPEFTANVNALGTLRILEAIRILNLTQKTKFYQASTSELFGMVAESPQNEKTPFYPRSPYAVAKLYAYWITVNYREAYGIFACNGILFNHESSRRGEEFVTRKITINLTKIAFGTLETLEMGNLASLRDWGHAKDYVAMQWKMLQENTPKDYVIASGMQSSVKDFIISCTNWLGIEIKFTGKGIDEIATVTKTNAIKAPKIKLGQVIVRVNPEFYRPAEVITLLGNPLLAKENLGWYPKITLSEMIDEMMTNDYKNAFNKNKKT